MPLLGTTALGIQKLLPSMQQTYGGLSIIRSYRKVMINIIGYLNQRIDNTALLKKYKPLSLEDKIVVKNLSFRYKEGEKMKYLKT